MPVPTRWGHKPKHATLLSPGEGDLVQYNTELPWEGYFPLHLLSYRLMEEVSQIKTFEKLFLLKANDSVLLTINSKY